MAYSIGIMGDFNSGKSYPRKFIEDGNACFLITPTSKASYLTDKDGKPVKALNFSSEKSANAKEMLRAIFPDPNVFIKKTTADLVTYLVKTPKVAEAVTPSGNFQVCTIEQVKHMLFYISEYMPHIKNVFIGDFTHFITSIVSRQDFIDRKSGGEAFQKFWELAGQVIRDLIESTNTLREDLVVITEYHTAYDEKRELFGIFVPGGNMFNDKFKLESYYDYMLCTRVLMDEKTNIPSEYQFVTERVGHLNARFANLFPERVIPANWETVLTTFRTSLGI